MKDFNERREIIDDIDKHSKVKLIRFNYTIKDASGKIIKDYLKEPPFGGSYFFLDIIDEVLYNINCISLSRRRKLK